MTGQTQAGCCLLWLDSGMSARVIVFSRDCRAVDPVDRSSPVPRDNIVGLDLQGTANCRKILACRATHPVVSKRPRGTCCALGKLLLLLFTCAMICLCHLHIPFAIAAADCSFLLVFDLPHPIVHQGRAWDKKAYCCTYSGRQHAGDRPNADLHNGGE